MPGPGVRLEYSIVFGEVLNLVEKRKETNGKINRKRN